MTIALAEASGGVVDFSRYIAPHYLSAAHLWLCGAVLVWDIWIAGHAAQLRSASRPAAVLNGVAGLLLLPALTVYLLSGSLLTGRAFAAIAWVWPVTVALIAAQAVYSAARGGARPAIAIPIAIYDVLLAFLFAAGYAVSIGQPLAIPLVSLVAAHREAIALGAQPLALLMPWYLFVPIVAPLTPGRRGIASVVRAAVAVIAVAWGSLLILALPTAARAVRSYEGYSAERLRERPDHDFTIGLKVFPTLSSSPPSISVQRDLALADSIDAQALCVYVSPSGASNTALRSLAQALEDARTGRRLIIALDLSSERRLVPRNQRSSVTASGEQEQYLRSRVRDVERIARILRPDYLVPVVDPNGATARALGQFPRDAWKGYLTSATRAAHAANPDTRVMAHVGGFGPRDSSLYAWAASSAAPVDAVGLTLFPWLSGARALDARERVATSWLHVQRAIPTKEHWVLEAGGFPMAHGDLNQSRAIWAILSWATNSAEVKGVIVFEASDYATPLGIQTAAGRIRLAAGTVKRAIAGLVE